MVNRRVATVIERDQVHLCMIALATIDMMNMDFLCYLAAVETYPLVSLDNLSFQHFGESVLVRSRPLTVLVIGIAIADHPL